jgi:hypothetical protein
MAIPSVANMDILSIGEQPPRTNDRRETPHRPDTGHSGSMPATSPECAKTAVQARNAHDISVGRSHTKTSDPKRETRPHQNVKTSG